MIIVDTALAQRASDGNPITRRHDRRRVHGAGRRASGRDGLPRDPDRRDRQSHTAKRRVRPMRRRGRPMLSNAGRKPRWLAAALREGRAAVTTDPCCLPRRKGIDVLLEVTGAIEDALPAILAGIEQPQAHRPDECRARRHGRPDPQGQGGSRGRRLHQCRRRPARRHDEPLPVREGDRRAARCSAATSRVFTIPTGHRRRRRSSPSAGASVRAWSPHSPTARRSRSSRRSSRTAPGCASPSAACTARRSPAGTPIQEVAQAYPLEDLLEGPGIVDYVGRRLARTWCVRSRHDREPAASATTSISTSSARGRSTASTRPIISAISRCRTRSRARRCSATRRSRRSERRWSR